MIKIEIVFDPDTNQVTFATSNDNHLLMFGMLEFARTFIQQALKNKQESKILVPQLQFSKKE